MENALEEVFTLGKIFSMALSLGLLLLIQGCGIQPKALDPSAGTEPVELTIYKTGLNLTETEFQHFFVEPVKKKYPHITLKLIVDQQGRHRRICLPRGRFLISSLRPTLLISGIKL
jgi:hypothetical protein